MLSQHEIQRIHQRLDNDPPSGVRKKLNKQLTEHRYASTLPPFTPLAHHRCYLNRLTSEQTLREIIDAAKNSSMFLMDTESVLVYRQPNRPALIQLQILPRGATPIVVIIEMHHLPPSDCHQFEQIRIFFRIVLTHSNEIYTWGSIKELDKFVQFGLFTMDQILMPKGENLQNLFKIYWQQTHAHQSADDCQCESCIGINPANPWSLQDAVAHLLHEWLDKRHSCSPFDIGLDPLFNRPRTESSYDPETLSNYAADDCLSMEKILSRIQHRPPSNSQLQQPINHDNTNLNVDEPTTSPQSTVEFIITIPVQFPAVESEDQYDFQYDQSSIRQHSNSHLDNQQHRSSRQYGSVRYSSNNSRRFSDLDNRSNDLNHDSNFRDHRSSDYRNRSSDYRHHSSDRCYRSNDRHHHSERSSDRIHHLAYDQRSHNRSDLQRQHNRHHHYNRSESDQHHRRFNRWELEPHRHEENRSTVKDPTTPGTTLRSIIIKPAPFSEEERKRMVNRKCTLQQRARNYRYVIIRRGIDPRFTILMVKEILRRYDVPYAAVNISKSQITCRKSLYIGFRIKSNFREYENRTRNLFTTDFYNEFHARNHRRTKGQYIISRPDSASYKLNRHRSLTTDARSR